MTRYAGKGYVAFRKKVSETITFTLTVIDEDTIPEPSLYITMHFSQARNNIQHALYIIYLYTVVIRISLISLKGTVNKARGKLVNKLMNLGFIILNYLKAINT